MAHRPLRMTIAEAHMEVDRAWRESYSPRSNTRAIDSISDKTIDDRASHLIARLFFRGIYFPQMSKRAWVKLIAQNRRPIFMLVKEAVGKYRVVRQKKSETEMAERAI